MSDGLVRMSSERLRHIAKYGVVTTRTVKDIVLQLQAAIEVMGVARRAATVGHPMCSGVYFEPDGTLHHTPDCTAEGCPEWAGCEWRVYVETLDCELGACDA